MALHRIHLDQDLHPGQVAVRGEEAHHAVRVKRLETGDPVILFNGRGQVGRASVAAIAREGRDWRLDLGVAGVDQAEPATPQLRVLTAAPKGSRLTDLIDGLSQAGAASWALLHTERGAVDPRPGKLDRLARTAAEASKQCGRAWDLRIDPEQSLAAALGTGPTVLADASGEPYRRTGAPVLNLLVGPEGGWAERELRQARETGAVVARFGPHTMRIETAASIAAAIILDIESRG